MNTLAGEINPYPLKLTFEKTAQKRRPGILFIR